MIEAAEKQGLLKPGGWIVEATAGLLNFSTIPNSKETLALASVMQAIAKATKCI
jgi:S-methylmethionine-dependent homocysteine/selenocysteine methylase